MVDISGMTVSEGTEQLKGQPFLLNIFQPRACAAIMRNVVKNRAAERTLGGHRASYKDIA